MADRTKGAAALESAVRPRMTVEKLAEAMGRSRNTVEAWIRGKKHPTSDELVRLQDILEIPFGLWAVPDDAPSEPKGVTDDE